MITNFETTYKNTKKNIGDRVMNTLDPLLKDVYMSGWHDGRHYDRDKWEQCGYLIIDPERIQEIEEKTKNSPCKDCPCATTTLKIGCYKGRKDCKPYEDYCFLWELKEHFSKKHYVSNEVPFENAADDLLHEIRNK